jgi:hypothetical protein
MITMTKRGIALVALIVATGFATLGIKSDSAQSQTMTRDQAYSAARLDTVFDLVATMPAAKIVTVPLAMKGDLPVPLGCFDASADTAAECMDAAYELPSEPSIVFETSEGTTTTLMRADALTVAGSPGKTLQPGE